mgnify:CR=1 FL=1
MSDHEQNQSFMNKIFGDIKEGANKIKTAKHDAGTEQSEQTLKTSEDALQQVMDQHSEAVENVSHAKKELKEAKKQESQQRRDGYMQIARVPFKLPFVALEKIGEVGSKHAVKATLAIGIAFGVANMPDDASQTIEDTFEDIKSSLTSNVAELNTFNNDPELRIGSFKSQSSAQEFAAQANEATGGDFEVISTSGRFGYAVQGYTNCEAAEAFTALNGKEEKCETMMALAKN